MPDSLTVHSSDISYCKPSELFIRYDRRLISRLISDTGSPITDDFQLNNNNVLKTMLREASAIVESYAYKGGRYTKHDLMRLYNDSNSIGRELLVGLVASITLYLLWRRRGDPSVPIPNDYQLAEKTLRDLERGYNVFAFSETMKYGRYVDAISNSVFASNNNRVISLRRLTGNTLVS